jgi:hypothetical protein
MPAVAIQRQRGPKVFVSHSSADKEFVRRLVQDLQNADVPVWFDEREIELGDSIFRAINEALENTEYLLLIHSRHGAVSPWVQAEVASVFEHHIKEEGVAIITCVLDDTQLPPLLRDRLWVDFRNSYEQAVRKLIGFFRKENSKVGCAGSESLRFPPVQRGGILAGPPDDCPTRLSQLQKRELRKRLQIARVSRDKLAVIWGDVLENRMEDEVPGKALDFCIQELIFRADGAGRMMILLNVICSDVPGV